MPRSRSLPCLAPGAVVLAWFLAAQSVRADVSNAGRAVFEGACAGCHAAGSPRVLAGQPLLERRRAITGSDPSEAIGMILHGRQPPAEQRGPWMPGFAAMLGDQQIADVLNWLRQEAGESPWPGLQQQVKAQR